MQQNYWLLTTRLLKSNDRHASTADTCKNCAKCGKGSKIGTNEAYNIEVKITHALQHHLKKLGKFD